MLLLAAISRSFSLFRWDGAEGAGARALGPSRVLTTDGNDRLLRGVFCTSAGIAR
jgi:hypothetical protein